MLGHAVTLLMSENKGWFADKLGWAMLLFLYCFSLMLEHAGDIGRWWIDGRGARLCSGFIPRLMLN